jgi:hypothetical protein
MTLGALYRLVGLEFIHEMSPFGIKTKGDYGDVEYADSESVGMTLKKEGEYIAQPEDLDSFILRNHQEIMTEFWKCIDAGVKPNE